ncbi:MAG: serine/threonine protein kinase [Bdellovibrionales bacterium]|nr:serine/threonine protein kinase [Bdellovibrionales bacterium]
MSSEVLKKFGRYFLLDLIAQGGMAEIYRARLAAKDGAGRLVVVKRIQAGFGGNNEFLQMFKSEIKVTMGFNHQNIVQVYDFGEEQAQPFITMELVDGKNLRQLLNRFRELGQTFPVELAAHIIEQAAAGLHYAHTYKDKISGDALNVVHRDISPQNILISYEGSVKIIDFGIAKATTNSEHTRAGVIKGKPSYLAPEQISGETLDGRTDLFALGTVFWELLVGKKLFAGDNDLAVLKMIESCTSTVRPPSELNPNVPKELDAIVMKLLAKTPEKRYHTGEELQRTLRRFLNSYAPDFASSDLSHVAKELFQREIVEDRKKIQRLNERVEQLLLNEVPEINAGTGETSGKREETTTFVARPAVGMPKAPMELKVDDEAKNQPPLMMERPARPLPPRPASAGSATERATRVAIPTPGSAVHAGTNSFPKTNTALGRTGGYYPPESSSGFGFRGIAAACAAVVLASWAGPKTQMFEVPFVSKAFGWRMIARDPAGNTDPKPVPTLDVDTPPPASRPAKLRLNIYPDAAEVKVSVNGLFVPDPSKPIDVRTDTLINLSVQRAGFKTFQSEFKIDSRSLEATGEYVKEISLDPERVQNATVPLDNRGFLTVRSTPSAEVKIFVNGQFWAQQFAPFEMLPVPVGKLKLYFYNSTIDYEDVVEVESEKNRTKQVQSNLHQRKH